MEALTKRLICAKEDKEELNRLISEYMPFIKSEVSKTRVFGMEYDDRLSIAMLVFMNCVRQYNETKGGFFAFASTCIRNRLIDEGQKQARQTEKVIPLFPDDEAVLSVEHEASIKEYEREQEQRFLLEEIDALSQRLDEFNISFDALTSLCPKQKRSRELCLRLANEVVGDEALRENLFASKRLPQSELAKRLEVSEKTVEKYRRYVIVLAVILSGDYPGIGAFLPNAKEVV